MSFELRKQVINSIMLPLETSITPIKFPSKTPTKIFYLPIRFPWQPNSKWRKQHWL